MKGIRIYRLSLDSDLMFLISLHNPYEVNESLFSCLLKVNLFYLKAELQREVGAEGRDKEVEISYICWFTPQVFIVARVGPDLSQ